MKHEITRDIVNDLWPLCRSREASADSRNLVDAYLAEHGDFAATLRESEALPGAMPVLRLSPDAERRLLDDARRRARLRLLVIGGAVAFAGILLMSSLVMVSILMFR